MARLWRDQVILAKKGATYGVDSVPAAATDAMLATVDITIEPLAGQEVQRDLARPFLGHQGVEFVGTHVRAEFSIELAGSGAAGTAPAYGVLLRACGLAETIVAATSAAYEPVSSTPEWVDIYMVLADVRHVLLGARGTFVIDVAPSQIPRLRFTFLGLLGPIADAVVTGADISAFQRPRPASKANTPVATIHGLSAPVESFQFTLGNQVEPRMLINHESIEIVDRQSVGTAVLEAKSLATKDWFAIAMDRTRGAVALQQGTAAGNIVTLSAAAVEIGRPGYGQTQQIVNNTIPLMFCSDAGDDEFALTFT